VAAFQPHRFTRTHELFDEFVTAFYDADVLVLTDVYAAGEQPIKGADAERLSNEIRRHGQKDVTYIGDREQIPAYLAGVVREGDIVITLGAGNIWQQGGRAGQAAGRHDLSAIGIAIRGELRLNEPMSRHTSLKVGGPADIFAVPADLDDLLLLV
jgi:hypothetical protein